MRRLINHLLLALLCATLIGCHARPFSASARYGCGQPACAPSTAFGLTHSNGYAPRYQSSWARVPVTAYGPVVQNNFVTGQAMTTLQPCNTWEWQSRRTRALSLHHRPVYWSSYNTRYRQTLGTGCGSASTTPAAAPTPQYYPRSESSVTPLPTEERSSPADNRPQLDPINWRDVDDNQSAARETAPSKWPVSVKGQAVREETPEVLGNSGWQPDREW